MDQEISENSVTSDVVAQNAPSALLSVAEVLSAVSSDLSRLAELQDFHSVQLEELQTQLSTIRQIVDYTLFVTPEQVENKEDLYPFSLWIEKKFSALMEALNADKPIPLSIEAPNLQALQTTFSTELSGIHKHVGESLESLNSIREKFAALENSQSDKQVFEGVFSLTKGLEQKIDGIQNSLEFKLNELARSMKGLEQLEERQLELIVLHKGITERQSHTPASANLAYDDLDLKIDELRIHLDKKTSRLFLFENFFMSMIMFMLFVNLIVICLK